MDFSYTWTNEILKFIRSLKLYGLWNPGLYGNSIGDLKLRIYQTWLNLWFLGHIFSHFHCIIGYFFSYFCTYLKGWSEFTDKDPIRSTDFLLNYLIQHYFLLFTLYMEYVKYAWDWWHFFLRLYISFTGRFDVFLYTDVDHTKLVVQKHLN